MKVFVLEAEHFSVPGRVVKTFATSRGADVEAASIVQIMLNDARAAHDFSSQPATADTWQDRLGHLQNVVGAQYCYVEISEHELAA